FTLLAFLKSRVWAGRAKRRRVRGRVRRAASPVGGRRMTITGIALISRRAALGGAAALALAAPVLAQDGAGRSYIYASQLQGHPYLLDSLLGMDYAEEKFGVTIDRLGPQGWDPVAGAEAVEQAIAQKPAGIITTLWEPGAVPGIRRAMEQGIPVVV